jgi:hypothetical protein
MPFEAFNAVESRVLLYGKGVAFNLSQVFCINFDFWSLQFDHQMFNVIFSMSMLHSRKHKIYNTTRLVDNLHWIIDDQVRIEFFSRGSLEQAIPAS